MNRYTWLLALTLALLLGTIATRAQFETPGRAFHGNTAFPLTGRHQTVACESCHLKGVFKGTPTACYDCHWVRRQDDKFKTKLGTQCENCHRTISWAAVRWDHGAMTGMPLNGGHRTLGCESCHTDTRFERAEVSCIACHQKDYAATKSPNHAAAGFPTPCDACHRPSDVAFTQARFDHNASFPLNGGHANIACATCHKAGVYQGTPRECASCHQNDFTQAKNPNHVAAGFPTQCELCHKPTQPTWTGGGTGAFNHSIYPLTGQHTTVSCANCHKNNVFVGTPRDCVGCHRTNYERTTAPNHAAASFPLTCESCHRTSDIGWKNGGQGFNHNQFFPLVGTHQLQQCATCHRGNVYKGTSRDCAGCHLPLYQHTSKPNHQASGFSTSCENCHRPTDTTWNNGGFNHNIVYPLAGKHAAAACATCHRNNVYKGTPRDCVGCHKPDYDRTAQPNHAQAGIPTTCENCHRPSDATWRNGNFNHNTVFALVGKHAAAACASCHVNNVFKGTGRDCVDCHRPQYDKTTTPNHASAGFSIQCATCHKATDPSWSGVAFNHNAFFQLQGKHTAAACASCHVNGVYKGTGRNCVDCHLAKYNATTTPKHSTAGFSTACESCHKATDSQWTGVSFNHNAFFALQGKHAAAQCASCHVNNVYKGTGRNCVDCHLAKYNATTTPKHSTAGFSTQCDSCHKATDSQWTGVSFNHNAFFPLVGKHTAAACASCHVNNVYKGTGRNCVDCHQAKYNATTAPNHAAAGFSTQCDSCHKATDSQWTGITFNHNTFFQLQGKHVAAACASCHVNNVYKGTSRTCVGCHLAKYNATSNPNHASSGFPTTCETCHLATDTAWTQGRFSHPDFPITSGKHANVPCAQCHNAPPPAFTCLTCHLKAKMDSEHQGRSGYRYDSAACYSCHPNGRKP